MANSKMSSQRLAALDRPAGTHKNGEDCSEWPLTVQNLAIHEASETSAGADPTPPHLGVLVPPLFIPPLLPYNHQPHPQPYLYPPNMNEGELGLHREVREQSGAPYPNSQQQMHGYYQQQAPHYIDHGGYWYYGSQQQGPYGGYFNTSFSVPPMVYGNNQFGVPPIMSVGCYDGHYQQQAPPFPDHGNYWYYGSQKQGYENNPFGVPSTMDSEYYGGYYGEQYVIPNHIDNQFGSPTHMDGGYYGKRNPPYEGYNTQGGVSVDTNHGLNHTHVEISTPNMNSGRIDYDGEFDPHHNGHDRGPIRHHSISVRQEQMLAEKSCYYEVLLANSSNSVPPSNILSLQDIDSAPQINLSTFNNGSRSSPSILYGPNRLQGSNSIVSYRPMNKNSALVTGDPPSRNSVPAPIRVFGRSQTGNPIVDTNSALVRLPRRHPGPHPPRWRCEDAIATEAASSRLPEGSNVCEDEREEKSASNIFSSLFLKSILDASTVFEDLAHSNTVPETSVSITHCPYILKGRCQAALGGDECCSDKLHFRRVVHAQTDVRLGDCSFLDSCDLADRCPYIHYAPEIPESGTPLDRLTEVVREALGEAISEVSVEEEEEEEVGMGRLADHVGLVQVVDKPNIDGNSPPDLECPPSSCSLPQWIKCDVRHIDLDILGKFGAVMADPPWDIRMTLPYGTVPDQAILDLPFQDLQDEGVFFLWCTARAVDTGHICLKTWGYEVCDEVAWVKVDHLRRLISVGRTGHWLNHTMEHCLVGVKGNPEWIKKGCGTNVIVSQPRATSHKPDEVCDSSDNIWYETGWLIEKIYELIERLVGPDTRKLELFGREHNIRKGWLTLGNQLPNTYLWEEKLKESLVKDPANKGPGNTYTDWDPWIQGFTRYGYGEPKDWREERRVNANYGRYRVKNGKEIRAGGGGGSGCGGRAQKAVIGKQSGVPASSQGNGNAPGGDENPNPRGGPKCIPSGIHGSMRGSKKKRKAKISENPEEWGFNDENRGVISA